MLRVTRTEGEKITEAGMVERDIKTSEGNR